MSNEKTRERELRAILDLPPDLLGSATVVSMNHEEQIKESGRIIKITPAWKWLLQK